MEGQDSGIMLEPGNRRSKNGVPLYNKKCLDEKDTWKMISEKNKWDFRTRKTSLNQLKNTREEF